MARMYPNRLAEDVQSHAEKELYRRFRDDLDDSYVVFHSVNWQTLDGRGLPRDGESDFIIAHPQRGIIVLEVKGGAIRCEPRTGQWTSTDRGGVAHRIKDPFYQVRKSKYALLDALELMLNMPQRRFNLVDAVAFPDTVIKERLPGLDKPREIVLDQLDLLGISAWVGRCLAYGRGPDSQRDTAPGEAAMEALMQLLGKSWELRPAMWGDFRREQEELIQLTQQQYQLLDLLSRHRRALISGCAGSGKTLLAVEKAQRLANQKFRVLFTCFSKSLAADLRNKLPQMENFEILHFHDLCAEMARQADIELGWPAGNGAARQAFFDEQLPELLLEAADVLRHVRYDAIVVDEGQDFHENWWIPIQTLLRDPDEGILYIFYDDNQRIYGRLDAFPLPGPPYALTINCRNTQQIHRQVIRFYDNEVEPPTARGPHGRPIETLAIDSEDDLIPTIAVAVRRLMEEEQVPAEEIVVLSTLRKRSRLHGKRDAAAKALLSDNWPPEPHKVYATTIHDFKGLESAVAILVEVERWPSYGGDLQQLLYVACSRARNHLITILPTDAPDHIRDYFAPG